MFQIYLSSIEQALQVFFVLALALLIPLYIFHCRNFGYFRPVHAIVFYLFLFYSLCATFLVTLPLPEVTDSFCQIHSFSSQFRPIAFQFVVDIVEKNHVSLGNFNLISILKSSEFIQAFGNFLLLMPLGFFLRYYFQTNFRRATIIAIATTLTFEITQITGIYGIYPCPYRMFDVDDLILNTSGAIVGYMIMPLFWFLPKLHKWRKIMPQNVSLVRRLVAFVIDWLGANTLAKFFTLFLCAQPLNSYSIIIDLSIYSVWFILVPLIWNGQTLGKKLVLIHLSQTNQNKLQLTNLCIRYGLLIFLPIITDNIFYNFFIAHQENLTYLNNYAIKISLILIFFEVIFLLGFIIARKDNLGIHELLSQTKNAFTKPIK